MHVRPANCHLGISISSAYLIAMCLAPQVSVQSAGNRVVSHIGEHVDAGILPLEQHI